MPVEIGSLMPSRPVLTGEVSLLEMRTVLVTGWVIRKTASTLPTRSTTAIVAAALRAWASPTACAMTCCTSATERKVEGLAQVPRQPAGAVPLELTAGPLPPQAVASSAVATTVRNRMPALTAGAPSLVRLIIAVQGLPWQQLMTAPTFAAPPAGSHAARPRARNRLRYRAR